MALLVCQDCLQDVSDHADACPQCGRPMRSRASSRAWAFELAAIVGLFGAASMVYSLVFPEDMVVSEARVKFWFGFQLVAMAFAFAALGWWRRSRAESD